jgi:hypothetical protein
MGSITISKEVAVQEFEKWIAAKKTSSNKRESLIDCENEIISAICDGYLSLTEDSEWEHTLKFPLNNDTHTSLLKYKTRINVGVLNAELKGVDVKDINGRIIAYAAALTGQAKGIIRALDSEDNAIASCISTYFF